MTRDDIVNLIKYHCDQDNESFIRQAKDIADEFYNGGEKEIASFLYSMISNPTTIIPQSSRSTRIGVLEKVPVSRQALYLPESIQNSFFGIINACKRNIGYKRFLFFGSPGTGKTEAANQLARLLKKDLWKVNISELIDSYLGETSKNIASLFKNINNFPFKKNMLLLIDEIDALSLKRNDNRDIREMDRATTELFSGIDSLSEDVVLIATTNLMKDLDKALVRRFSASINFDAYSKEDLVDIGIKICNVTLEKTSDLEPNNRLLSKILLSADSLPNPGDLKNIIISSIAFSSFNNKFEYLANIYNSLNKKNTSDLKTLSLKGFSIRDIQDLTGISKSEVARRLQK